MGGNRILVVDDDPDIVEYICTFLEDNDYIVSSADSSLAAIAQLEQSEVDLVIVDVLMPGRSGLDLIVKLRKDLRWRELRVEVLTGNDQVLQDGGVSYINDSKATNVDATVKSLMGLDGGAVLILGGKDKGGDFSSLIPHLGRVRKIILIGEAKSVIRKALAGKCALEDADDMIAAVKAAANHAKAGDTVLLAPACASFDMFDNYQHRGEVFRSCVNALTAETS